MRRFPLPLALGVLLLAVFGAILHPFAMLLSLTPLDSQSIAAFLQEARSLVADLLGWGLLGLLIAMAAYVTWGRVFERNRHSEVANWFREDGSQPSDRSVPRIVVAITAYNDAQATAQAVRDYKRQEGVVKVLVIDNNSTDGTAELAEAAGGTVIHESQQGYGYTCIRGLSEALKVSDADVIVLTEGDGTFVAEDIAKFVAYMDHADLVVGNRVVRGLVATDSQMDHFFIWGNMAVAMLLRLRFWDGHFLGPAGLTDVGCTFRAMRRHALERILPDLTVGGNHFSPHMLLVAMAHGVSVVEIPIRFRRRVGQSKGASGSMWKGLEVGLAMIWHILTFSPKSASRRPGVLVERDGVIIRHQGDGGHVEFVPGAAEGLVALSRHGHRVIVVGDQAQHDRAGISRRLARAIDARIAAEVEHRGGRVDAFVLCPHDGKRPCTCWQNESQLLLTAARRSPLDLTNAVVVSDRPLFLDAAAELGCRTIFVGDAPSELSQTSLIGARAPDLAGAVKLVLESAPLS